MQIRIWEFTYTLLLITDYQPVNHTKVYLLFYLGIEQAANGLKFALTN